MSALRLFQTVELPVEVQALFDHEFEVVRLPDQQLSACEIKSDKQSVLLCSITSGYLSADVIRSLPPSLGAIATYSVGTDHIDLVAAGDRGIAVFNTPGVLENAVADAAMFLMLGAARRATESIALIREGRWKGWSPRQLVGVELAGRTLGILGLGGIGTKVATRALGFGLKVAYTNRRPIEPSKLPATFVADADELVRQSDILLLACPSTDQTRGFLNRHRLAQARPDLIVVNVGRGDLVVDDDLIDALAKRKIFAAGLDVFIGEPAIDPRYLELPNAFITPHIGSSTREARFRMGQILIERIKEWEGGKLSNSVA